MRTLMVILWTALLAGCTLGPQGGAIGPRDDRRGHQPGPPQQAVLPVPSAIPDGDPAGVAFGPIVVGRRGETIADVGLSLNVFHECTEDLAVALCYDVDNDGRVDVAAPTEFYRARIGGYGSEEQFLCPQSLDGAYFFAGDLYGIFDGLESGGSFYLAVADTLDVCLGELRSWTVRVGASSPDCCDLGDD